MSIYETSITNPKKQLEFYKQLSEQLQRENQRLKIQISAREENYNKLEDNWKELWGYIFDIFSDLNCEDDVYPWIEDILDKMAILEKRCK